MRKKIKLSKAIWVFSFGAFFSNLSTAALSVSYDQMLNQSLPMTILYPFSYQGLVSVSENNFPNYQSYLPKNLPDYWDVVVVGRDILEQECRPDGQLEVLDYDNFPHRDLLTSGAIQQCGVGFSVQGMTLNYALVHKYGVPPVHWVDLFDFNRFPGKRALPKQAKYLLEAVLLADGVQPSYLYPLLATQEGQDRAFNKLDLIYDDILWWSDVNNLKLWLDQGIVSMSIAPDGAMLSNDGLDNVGVSRHQVIYEMKYYAILKSSQQKDLAYAFISYATQPDQQLKFTHQQYYGPTIKQAWRLVSPSSAEYITNHPKNLQGGILLDYNFYAEHGAALEARFNDWLVSKEAPVKRVSAAINRDESLSSSVKDEEIEFVGPSLDLFELNFIGPQRIDFNNDNKDI
ncbi:extracellular solute-binding protein [Wohlfahrtiimonas larvae]|nr:extracellular solute-binding protein [Wohlfahrtiimonas larvae]